jgi:hypothetical protein
VGVAEQDQFAHGVLAEGSEYVESNEAEALSNVAFFCAIPSALFAYFFNHRNNGCQSDWCSRTWAEW